MMKINNEYLIPFIGLKLGKHQFEYQIKQTFFDNFDYHEFEDCDVKVEVVLEKKTTMLELSFKHSGTVYVPCDVTNEMFDLPIKGKIKMVVQFADKFNNDNEELLLLPHGEHQIDIAQYIYEMIALSVPIKRVNVKATKENELISTKSTTKNKETKQTSKEENIDPRWEILKKLLTDK